MDEPQGGARQVALLARDLKDLGEDVTVYCYRHDPERCFPETLRGVTVAAVETIARKQISRSDVGWRRSLAQLRRYFLEAPAIAALISPDTGLLNPHEWLAHRAAALFSHHNGTPVVWSYNDPSGWHVGQRRRIALGPRHLFGWFDTRLINRFSAITALDGRMRRIAEAEFTPPVHVIRSGVDARTLQESEASVEQRAETGNQNGISLISVGILFPHRRFEDAIRGVHLARQQGTDCHYQVIGSSRFAPDYARFLIKLVSDLNLHGLIRLRFDAITETELDIAYRQADALIFPNDQQTWGLAVLEAMARGVPVIVSRGAGVHEVLTEGQNALLVNPRRPDEIAAAIVLLANQRERRAALAQAARRLVRESYTSRHYAEQMLRLFQSLTVRSRRN
jgi:glycosyltransferase involved in cell wall biosynthesis